MRWNGRPIQRTEQILKKSESIYKPRKATPGLGFHCKKNLHFGCCKKLCTCSCHIEERKVMITR